MSRATHPPSTKDQTQSHGTVWLTTTGPFLFIYFLFGDSLRAADTVVEHLPNNGFNPQERERNRKQEKGRKQIDRQTDRLVLSGVHLQSLELGGQRPSKSDSGQARLC